MMACAGSSAATDSVTLGFVNEWSI